LRWPINVVARLDRAIQYPPADDYWIARFKPGDESMGCV